MKRILLAIDLPLDSAAGVLSFTEELAAATGSAVWLLHVAAPNPALAGLEAGPPSVRDSRAEVLRQEHQTLHEAAEELRSLGLEVHPLLVPGVTSEVILQQATSHQVDLIVLGSHGHGSLYKALLGSTSEILLRQAHCPVVIVPHPERAR